MAPFASASVTSLKAVYKAALFAGSIPAASFIPRLGKITEGAQLLTWAVSSVKELSEKDEDLKKLGLRFCLARSRYYNVVQQCAVGSCFHLELSRCFAFFSSTTFS